MNKKRVAFHTLGCKLNFAETSGLSRELQDECDVVDFSEPADYYVVQSCAVTATAEKKCRSAIRQAHKRNPGASIIVTGCMSQLRAEQLAGMEGVSLVLGNAEKFQLKEIIQEQSVEPSDKIRTSNILKDKTFHPSYSGSDRTRTFVKIQDGCDYFCSFCTIPFARGRSRSNSIAETINFIKTALREQAREIVLTGVNIGDFGKLNDESLFGLLKEIENLKPEVRFRLSSIEPDLLTKQLIEFVADSKWLLPHFHIPLQSGSDTVLKRMNRRYLSDIFVSKLNLIKAKLPFACIAADVIVGFPGETEEEFHETFSLIEGLPLSYLHVFPYSERPGTKAKMMDDKVRPEIIHERVGSLIRLSETKKLDFLNSNIGRVEEVLFEAENSSGNIGGFTNNYIRVSAPFQHEFINSVKKTRLTSFDKDGIFAFEPI
ncbi:MAG: tRNA (N(6)-L-threonylcarbamoyladenosine(37)-C(2))-methylthiotransferase MtaB [Bacteroidales bacterium]|nr:tRNA (N(6)-L-threonylcarbamoyladenosine(37)-C(2))-methylthiotransferase MtaB [Bacteroidales bacterium]